MTAARVGVRTVAGVSPRPGPFVAANIVALDQEQGGILAVVNGASPALFDPLDPAHLAGLPAGGGYVVADANTWAVRNQFSQSQYCWATEPARAAFLAALAALGYRSMVVANKLANSLYVSSGHSQADAVIALYDYVHHQIADPKGRPMPVGTGPVLGCGACTHHWSFDSGHAVRPTAAATIDISCGQRKLVARDFLVAQNDGGYVSAFADDAIAIAWAALDRPGRAALNLKKTRPEAAGSRNRLLAVAVCTHDPATGVLRTHQGRPWGVGFITKRVIGLCGTMRGTGERAPGNPMRAVLRVLGRRSGTKANPAERAVTDRAVRTVIRALQQHPVLPRPPGHAVAAALAD